MFKKKALSNSGETKPRNETEGVLNFSKEMISALATAVIFIIYVIQAFTIPTGSMEKSLRVGDFLLGIKFIYGSPVIPFTYIRFPGVTTPKRGDVIIFKYPGYEGKDYIKRCVAIAGDSLRMDEMDLYVNGIKLVAPPDAQFTKNGKIMGGQVPAMEQFSSLYIPKKGDTLKIHDSLPWREFFYYKRLIRQEHPRKVVTEKLRVIVDGVDVTDKLSYPKRSMGKYVPVAFTDSIVNDWDKNDYQFFWFSYDFQFANILAYNRISEESVITFKKQIFLDGIEQKEYVCKFNNYFMIGDNRDESQDSRFWGFLNGNFIKAKAFIIYFALNRDKVKLRSNGMVRRTNKEEVPWIMLPKKIRWNRLGKLIRGWSGKPDDVETLDPKEES